MRAEIKEQPARVLAAFGAVGQQAGPLAAAMRGASQVILLGRGSSRSASTYGAWALRTLTGLPAFTTSPAHLAWSASVGSLAGAVVIAVSQSGESTELVAAAARVGELGGRLVVVTNSPSSTLAGLAGADLTVAFLAGAEVAVPATKSFTTSLACLLGIALASRPVLLSEAAEELPGLMAALLDDAAARFDVGDAENLVCAGEGLAEAVGEEGAIKLRETLRRPVAAFETSEFLHGSINSVDCATTVIVAAADEVGRRLADQAAVGARARGARTVSISAAPSSEADCHVRLPDVPAHWAPFLAVLPVQIAALEAAVARGDDPDQPAGLTKVTRIADLAER
jgi:glucosamine--fructose-6-phosphate aminotransferase (isomerizing)